MSLWRFGRGWTEPELRAYLIELRSLPVNFSEPPEMMTQQRGWTVDGADTVIGHEPAGPPQVDGFFARAEQSLINYDFSDPRIVVGHYDPRVPLLGRDMLLEIKVFGLHFINGVRVQTVRDESDEHRTTFAFRYDTLQGHMEQGFEWFALSKNHASGEVRFCIEAHWRLGDFPNWWSRLGFLIVGGQFRHLWRRRAAARLRPLARQAVQGPLANNGEMAHRGDVTPLRREGKSPPVTHRS